MRRREIERRREREAQSQVVGSEWSSMECLPQVPMVKMAGGGESWDEFKVTVKEGEERVGTENLGRRPSDFEEVNGRMLHVAEPSISTR